MEGNESSGQAAVAEAVQLAQDAVSADNTGDAETAVALYRRAVDLIAYGLSVTEEDDENTETLLRYSSVYSARIEALPAPGAPPSGRATARGAAPRRGQRRSFRTCH